jgi:imidazolonepropionase-like amidohydrolase
MMMIRTPIPSVILSEAKNLRRDSRSFAALRMTGVALVIVAGASMSVGAQLGSHNPMPGPRGAYVIQNARIVTVSGAEIPRGSVVIGVDGRIAAVGANVAAPANARVIDAAGHTVYPGMMDAGTSIGLAEIGQGANATVDISEVGSFNPNAQAIFALNPHSAHVGVTRVVGITHVASLPTGGIISGQAAIVNLAGWTPPEMQLAGRAAHEGTAARLAAHADSGR